MLQLLITETLKAFFVVIFLTEFAFLKDFRKTTTSLEDRPVPLRNRRNSILVDAINCFKIHGVE